MTNTFMPDMDLRDRIQLLQDTAHSIEETKYYLPLSQENLDIKREQLTENLISLSQLEDELNEIKSSFKQKMDPLKIVNKTLLTEVKTKQELKEGSIYSLANMETSMMERYDHEGELIDSRRLRPEEKKGQSKLFVPTGAFVKKAANDQ